MSVQDQHELDVHISSSPGLLQRVLGTCAEPIQSLHQLMLLTMHAVLLETGMQLTHQVLPVQNLACLRRTALPKLFQKTGICVLGLTATNCQTILLIKDSA